MKLLELNIGETGKIVRVLPNSIHNRRLCEMGFLPGTLFKIAHIAPLGYPITIEIRGYKVVLSKLDALSIEIEKVV